MASVSSNSAQSPAQLDPYEVFQEQAIQSIRLFSQYKSLKRDCRDFYEDLQEALEKKYSKLKLMKAKSALGGCNEELVGAGEQLGPFAINIYRLASNPNLFLADGWSRDQVLEGLVWVKRFEVIWTKLNQIYEASPTEGEIRMLLHEADAHIARNLLARTSTGFFFYKKTLLRESFIFSCYYGCKTLVLPFTDITTLVTVGNCFNVCVI